MSRNPVSNFAYSFVAWLPILAVLGAFVWVLAVGVMNLEVRTFGSEFFVGNDQTSNMPEWKMQGQSGASSGGSDDVAMLTEALNSGDTGRMQAALAQHEMNNAAR